MIFIIAIMYVVMFVYIGCNDADVHIISLVNIIHYIQQNVEDMFYDLMVDILWRTYIIPNLKMESMSMAHGMSNLRVPHVCFYKIIGKIIHPIS